MRRTLKSLLALTLCVILGLGCVVTASAAGSDDEGNIDRGDFLCIIKDVRAGGEIVSGVEATFNSKVESIDGAKVTVTYTTTEGEGEDAVEKEVSTEREIENAVLAEDGMSAVFTLAPGGFMDPWNKPAYKGYKVEVADKTITAVAHEVSPDVDKFVAKTYTTPEYTWGEKKMTTMDARYFVPDKETYAKPEGGYALVIWLHGGGEVGTDNRIHIAANDVPRWTEKDSQDIFGGNYVLAPQNHASAGEGAPAATMSLIEQFIEEMGDVDVNRIYIGGCSYGGMGTWQMIRNYPDFFAAAYPICGNPPGGLTDEEIQALKDLPIYMTDAAGDNLTGIVAGMIDAYNDLYAAGAKNLHISMFNHSEFEGFEGFVAEPGAAPMYFLDHFSWTYAHNNYDAKGDDYDGRNFIDTKVDAEYKDFVAGSSAVVKDGKLTFTYKPTEDGEPVSITLEGPSERPEDTGYATFKEWIAAQKKETTPPAPTHKFTDVPAEGWLAEAVEYVFQKDLFKGTSETTFSPDMIADRAMVVTVLYRMENAPAPQSASSSFSDVAAGKWYADAITWAAENKIVEGYEDGTFRPTEAITREQLLTILCRYSKFKGQDTTPPELALEFSDADQISEFAIDAVRWAAGKEIIANGTGALRPTDEAPRSELAAFLMRYCENVAK